MKVIGRSAGCAASVLSDAARGSGRKGGMEGEWEGRRVVYHALRFSGQPSVMQKITRQFSMRMQKDISCVHHFGHKIITTCQTEALSAGSSAGPGQDRGLGAYADDQRLESPVPNCT